MTAPPAGTAFLFPGQGAQRVGMGRALCERFAASRRVFEEVNAALGMDLSALCFEGPEEELRRTVNAQPALLTVSVAALRALEARGVSGSFAAGHSLGEFSAWVASGALALADALPLVRLRAEVMDKAATQAPGAMAAVIGLEEEHVARICQLASSLGTVVPANFNAPDQVVISGGQAAVQRAGELAVEAGAKVVPLSVSGAFHSPLMAAAAEQFAEAVEKVKLATPRMPVAANATADLVRTEGQVRAAMAAQMTSPVLWRRSMERLRAEGARRFLEIGPGKVLAGLMRRIAPGAQVVSVEEPGAVEAALREFGA